MELLESRIAPAGLITVTLAGGNVSLVGDAEGNALKVEQTEGGNLVLTPLDGTMLRNGNGAPTGDPLTIEGLLGDLSISLLGGSDRLEVGILQVSGDLSVQASIRGTDPSLDILNFDNLEVTGNMRLEAGSQAKVSFIGESVAIQGYLHLLNRTTDPYDVTLPQNALTVGKDLWSNRPVNLEGEIAQITVMGRWNGSFNTGVSAESIEVKKSVALRGSIDIAAGELRVAESVSITGPSIAVSGITEIGGNVQLKLSGSSLDVAGDGSIAGSLAIKLKTGLQQSVSANIGGISVGGDLRVIATGPGETASVVDLSLVTVIGNTKLDNRSAAPMSGTVFASEIADLSFISKAKGADGFTFASSTVTGDTRVSLGAGNDSISFAENQTTFDGSITFAMGGGDDLLDLGVDTDTPLAYFRGGGVMNGEKGTDTFILKVTDVGPDFDSPNLLSFENRQIVRD